MTIADWCILVVGLLPLVALAPAKVLGRHDYDNSNPRAARFYADGLRARAWGAHLNGFEAFPFFAAAVLLAEMRHSPQWIVDVLAVSYTVSRMSYVAAYLLDHPCLRSGLWALALLLNIALMIVPAIKPWW